jgi:hypothetical protein
LRVVLDRLELFRPPDLRVPEVVFRRDVVGVLLLLRVDLPRLEPPRPLELRRLPVERDEELLPERVLDFFEREDELVLRF